MIECVYVIGPEPLYPGALVKIGTTSKILERLRTFQTGSPVPLAVLWAIPGGQPLERWLHHALIEYRRHGEWFDLGPDPVQKIKDELGPWGVNVITSQTGDFPLRTDLSDLGEAEESGEEVPDEDAPVLNLSALARSLKDSGLDKEEVRARLVETYGRDTSRDTIRKATGRAFED